MSAIADAAGWRPTTTSGAANEGPTEKLTPWVARLKTSIACSRSVRGSNYIQIATVCPESGRPRNRTVVFRGLRKKPESGGGDLTVSQLKMITDTRSEKATHIRSNPACEAVYWFGKSSEQYRIDGDLILVDSSVDDTELQAARLEEWKKLNDPAREQFWWTAPGEYKGPPSGVPKGGRGKPAAAAAAAAAATEPSPGDADDDAAVPVAPPAAAVGKILPPPATFALLLLQPRLVKYLRLTDNLAIQDSPIPVEEGWECTRINP